MRTVAGITVGQAPRTDMTDDLRARLASNLHLVEYGALDNMTREEIEHELAPHAGEEVLVSRMRDGSQVMFSGTRVLPLVQQRIDDAETAGADAIIVLCTGSFPHLRHRVPLIYPQPLFHSVARALAGGRRIAVMVPEESQVAQAREWWKDVGADITVVQASPYGNVNDIARAARSLRESHCAFLCLDCMGFSLKMRSIARKESGIDVLLPRTLVASVVSELLG